MSLNRREISEQILAEYRSYCSKVECTYSEQQCLITLARYVEILLDCLTAIKPRVTVKSLCIRYTPVAYMVYILYEDAREFMIVFGTDTLNVYRKGQVLLKPEKLDLAYQRFRKESLFSEEVVDELMKLFRSPEEATQPLILPPTLAEIVPHWDFQEPDWAIQDDREWENSYVYPFYTHYKSKI